MIDYKDYLLGSIDSPDDLRDMTPDKLGIVMAEAPQEVLAQYRANVYNQGAYGQCVAFATASIIEAANFKERGIRTRYSTAGIYGNRDAADYQGEGLIPREALKRLSRYGTPPYSDFPLLDDYPSCKASWDTKRDNLIPLAMPQKIWAYCRLSATQIDAFISKYQIPILCTIAVYDSFYNTGVDGIVPAKAGSFRGGHSMQLIGTKYIGSTKYAIVQNSWGTSWGNGGLCFIDYASMPFVELWGLIDANPKQEINLPQKILYVIGETYYGVDDKLLNFDVAPILQNNRAYVPVRHWEHPGYGIKWKPSGKPNGLGSVIELTRGGESDDGDF